METRQQDETVFELTCPGGSPVQWHLPATGRTSYPLRIVNRTAETHDVEIMVADAVEWASVQPGRLTLKPGHEGTAALVLEATEKAGLLAGGHPLTLEVRDFEGTCLAHVGGMVVVPARHRASLAAVVRGPLLRRGLALGLVLRCTLTNEGNAECAASAQCDTPGWTAQPVSARVPPGGNVSFDMEIRWPVTPLRSYPPEISVRAHYPGGECRAALPWSEAAASLGSLLPPLQEDDEFPAVLELADKARQEAARQAAFNAGSADAGEPGATAESIQGAPSSAFRSEPIAQEVPVTVAIQLSPRTGRSGDQLISRSPMHRWVLLDWRLIVGVGLPLTVVFAGLGSWVLAHRPQLQLSAASHVVRVVPSSTHPRIAFVPNRRRVAQPPSRPASGHRTIRTAAPEPVENKATRPLGASPVHVGPSAPSRRHLPSPAPVGKALGIPVDARSPAWQGIIVHVSSMSVKVEDPMTKAVRAFVVLPDFKGVLSSDGRRSYSRSILRAGLKVRVFYSYVLGMRHANAILVLGDPRP